MEFKECVEMASFCSAGHKYFLTLYEHTNQWCISFTDLSFISVCNKGVAGYCSMHIFLSRLFQ